jgi:hypothetical protein
VANHQIQFTMDKHHCKVLGLEVHRKYPTRNSLVRSKSSPHKLSPKKSRKQFITRIIFWKQTPQKLFSSLQEFTSTVYHLNHSSYKKEWILDCSRCHWCQKPLDKKEIYSLCHKPLPLAQKKLILDLKQVFLRCFSRSEGIFF